MGRFVNPDNSAFQVALNSRIYVDKTGLLEYTNTVLDTMDAYIVTVVRADSGNPIRRICLLRITARERIPKKCFQDWRSVRQQISENILINMI